MIPFLKGALFGLGLMVAANLIAVHYRSDAGLLEGLGITNRVEDDVRRVGFPLVFYEEGGFAYRKDFKGNALFINILILLLASVTTGIIAGSLQKQRHNKSGEGTA